MLDRIHGIVFAIVAERAGVQEIQTDQGSAINYVELTGKVAMGDAVLLNRTARRLALGTGGYDFVMARLAGPETGSEPVLTDTGHIIKARYTPVQHAVRTLEEEPAHESCWQLSLDAFPVVVGQLHSQIAPVAAALALRGKKCAYVMTDGAALPIALSRLVAELRGAELIQAAITAGQTFGGDYETVTVHSALIAAAHILCCDAAIVCQGPGNAGTATPYGFSGIEQAHLLDIASALGGTPIAAIRASEADPRERHRGVSHHTTTSLRLVRSRCLVALPTFVEIDWQDNRHERRMADGTEGALRLLQERGVDITSMGRGIADDPTFFHAAAAAGLVAADIADQRTATERTI